MSNWVDQAEAALAGRASDDVDQVPVVKPQVLDATGRRAVVAPFLAAFFAAVAFFQEQKTGQPFDPLAMGLRLLAMAMALRAVVLGRKVLLRLLLSRNTGKYGLALTEAGLLLRTPTGDTAVPRQDVLAIKERGSWGDHSGRRWNEVYIVTRPASGRAFLALPPIFDRTTGVLAERLMRWRGPIVGPKGHELPPPVELPSKVFDQAAAGDASEDVTAIRHGATWLRRAPYATVLLGLVILDGFLRLPASSRDQIGAIAPGLIVFSLLVVPLLWAGLIRYDIAPRKGLALVLTPGEMLMRTRAGVHVVRWKNLESLKLEAKRRWSLLLGPHEVRSLVISRKDADSINYLEAFLGAPIEVVIALCDAYKRGQLP